ncbi:hypothetical protein PROFUN_08433 [Planoprotostelium fungivorum]|uniref:UspA domain-containing protein n=1 Tax=Planoprotostelium fungivorum TaxID=1890364 RepID=A0A2P6NJU7_9EUKA|nr:hypothetical protein PROFUN_08433 [Planoprotostelium fungivorum]
MARSVLNVIGKYCTEHHIKHEPVVSLAARVGEEIVHQVTDRKIDTLIVGKHEVKTGFFGSTSVAHYLIDNCPCSVLVAKGDAGPAEAHSQMNVDAVEEKERERRLSIDPQDPDLTHWREFQAKNDMDRYRFNGTASYKRAETFPSRVNYVEEDHENEQTSSHDDKNIWRRIVSVLGVE